MGMNYYACRKPCATCGMPVDETHIGKASLGWQFLFHGIPENGCISWKAWKELLSLPGVDIRNEDDEIFTLERFTSVVEDRNPEWQTCPTTDGWLDEEGYSFCPIHFS